MNQSVSLIYHLSTINNSGQNDPMYRIGMPESSKEQCPKGTSWGVGAVVHVSQGLGVSRPLFLGQSILLQSFGIAFHNLFILFINLCIYCENLHIHSVRLRCFLRCSTHWLRMSVLPIKQLVLKMQIKAYNEMVVLVLHCITGKDSLQFMGAYNRSHRIICCAKNSIQLSHVLWQQVMKYNESITNIQ